MTSKQIMSRLAYIQTNNGKMFCFCCCCINCLNLCLIKVWSNQTILKGNDFEVVSLVVLDDGSLASGYWNGDIIIWNTTNRTQIKVLISHTSTVNCLVVLTRDTLASGSNDNVIKIWNTTSGILIKNLLNNINSISSLVVLPQNILACSSMNTIILCNITNGEIINSLTGHTSFINSLIVLPNGLIASGSDDSSIRLWNTTTGHTVKILQSLTFNEVTYLVVLNDLNYLVSGHLNGDIKVWNLKNGQIINNLFGHTGI